ncbi:unnamed protein product [Ectocarpus sp. 8 AP-2014]
MAPTQGEALPRPRKPWRSSPAVCLCAFTALLTLIWPAGDAFVFSIRAPSSTRPVLQTATSTSTARCASMHGSTVVSSTGSEVVGGSREDSIELHDDGEVDDEDEDDFDDEDVHPSVSWLYPPKPSSATAVKTTDTRSKENKTRPSRRTLCVDYGTRRVGLAIGVGISPRAVPGVTNVGSDLEVARQVLVRARGEGIRDIVVGLPLERNGTETEMCEIVRGFASVLADVGAASRPTAGVFLWDERFSSAQAAAMLDPYGGGMSSKVEIDSLAASLILKHFFEEGGTNSAEKVKPSTGVVTAEVWRAAGRDGEEGEEDDSEGEKGEDAYGEGSRRRFQEMREESARSAAAGEDSARRRAWRKRRRR